MTTRATHDDGDNDVGGLSDGPSEEPSLWALSSITKVAAISLDRSDESRLHPKSVTLGHIGHTQSYCANFGYVWQPKQHVNVGAVSTSSVFGRFRWMRSVGALLVVGSSTTPMNQRRLQTKTSLSRRI